MSRRNQKNKGSGTSEGKTKRETKFWGGKKEGSNKMAG